MESRRLHECPAIPNLISILALSGILVHETRKYLWRNRLDEEMNV